MVTLTIHKDVRGYPCRSMESAIKLAECFIAGLSRHSPATADVTKLRPAPQQAEPTPAPAAETNPHRYDGPPPSAEQVAA